jgi:cytochrome c-type biogenesis protein CcmH/NrfG
MSPFPIDHRVSFTVVAPGADVPATKATLYRDLGVRKVRQFPGHFRGHLELGRALLEELRWRAAEVELRTAIRLNPLCMPAYYCLALAYLGEGGRLPDVDHVLRHAPMPRLDRLYLRGLQHLQADERQQAVAALGRVLAEKPDYLPARRALAGFALP